MKNVSPGDIIEFKGCAWSEGWEFDAPIIIYTPAKSYSIQGSICAQAIEDAIEDLCIDICLEGQFNDMWNAHTLKEFKWRGWSPRGFQRRKRAIHASAIIEFYTNQDGHLDFRRVKARQDGEVKPA